MAVENGGSPPEDLDADWQLASVSWPTIVPATVAVRYDDESDTLFVHLHGRSLPAVSVPLEVTDPDGVGYLYLDLALDVPAVVGVFVEDFATRALPLHPKWQALRSAVDGTGDNESVARFLEDVRDLWRRSLRHLVSHRAS